MPKVSKRIDPPKSNLDVQMEVWCEEYIVEQMKWMEAVFPNMKELDRRHYERGLRAGWLSAFIKLKEQGKLGG